MLFSANPGEEPRPLRKIASGGELSRLTLAVKTALAAVNRVPTLIFDEIDTGVGGRLARALGQALAELARSELRGEADRARAILLTLAGWASPEVAEAFSVTADSACR